MAKVQNRNIKPEEVAELRHILENERYIAISDGNIDILFTITTMIENIDGYMDIRQRNDCIVLF